MCCTKKEISEAIFKTSVNLKVFMSTKSLKHVYDRHIFEKKLPTDFYIILNNLEDMACSPNSIHEDVLSKRGSYIFTKEIKGKNFACILEKIDDRLEVVSAFTTGKNI